MRGYGYDKTESPAEDRLLHHLSHCYQSIIPQKPVFFGRYRVDFLTVDHEDKHTAWEIDGRAYHDYDRDLERDYDILHGHDGIHQIIRLEAGALHWFGQACCAALARLQRPWERFRSAAMDAKEAARAAIEIISSFEIHDISVLREDIDGFFSGECFDIQLERNLGDLYIRQILVGSPGAFVLGHPIWRYHRNDQMRKLDRHCRWMQIRSLGGSRIIPEPKRENPFEDGFVSANELSTELRAYLS